MTIIDGTSGSMPARKCGFSSRNSPGCPALASMATRAPSHIWRELPGGSRLAGVIEGRPGDIPARSDLSPSSTFPFLCRTTVYHRYYAERTARQGTSHRYAYALADCRGGNSLTGQRSNTDERLRTGDIPVGATSRSGGVRMGDRNLGNPCAEKVLQDRPRQNKGAAPLTKAPSAFRRIGGAVRQGTLTITGSNVRLGTEMPVALSFFWP